MRNLKKALALVLAMAMALSLAVTAGAAYKDGDKISAEYEVAVEVASQLGILVGFEDGTYGPQQNLTRAQLATMTYRLATADVDDVYTANFVGGATTFTDTTATAWYAGYVGYAADAGYLKGMGDGTYAPNSAMTGYQALAAFLRVIGYNQPGQFTGASWTVQVAEIATQNGLLKGIEGVDLNAAISREVAAQIIYNALFAKVVSYTPAFGYQLDAKKGSIAQDHFHIETAKAGVVQATAPWGQPATEWETFKGEVAVSIPFAPVAEYTTVVDECDLAKDLGVKEADVTEWYLNGEEDAVQNDLISMKHETKIGAQGTLTEVYEIDGKYWFVQIETWLGEIVETSEAVVDKNGHVEDEATAYVDVFECENHDNLDAEVITDEFAKGDYVLVNISYFEDAEGVYYLTETAPVDTDVLTQKGVNKNADYAVIGGETYDYAAHYHLNNPGALDQKYDVFVDFYGNLIGLVPFVEPAPETFITIWESAIAVTNGYNPYIAGKEVDLTSGELKDIKVCDDINKYSDRNIAYFHDIVEYTVCEDGEYAMEQVGSEFDGYVIEKGNSNVTVFDKVVTGYGPWAQVNYVPNIVNVDANTVFAIEDECGEYEIVVGYKNIDSMRAFAEIEVYNDGEDKFADVVYINAATAFFPGDDIVAYVMEGCEAINAGVDGDKYVTFSNVIVNGEVVDVMCATNFNLGLFEGMVTLKTDANGLVYAAAPIFGFVPATVQDNSDEIFVVNGVSFNITADTTIWVVDEAENTCVIGTAADVAKDASILFSAKGLDADTIIVYA